MRSRVKPAIDVIGQRGGQAVASVFILSQLALGRGDTILAVFVVVLCVAWIAAVAELRPHYVEMFRRALREGIIEALSLHSPTSQFGQLHRAEELQDNGEAEQYLKGVLDQLQDGRFAELWRKEQEDGYKRLEALRAKYLANAFCDASRSNREELKEVIDKGIV